MARTVAVETIPNYGRVVRTVLISARLLIAAAIVAAIAAQLIASLSFVGLRGRPDRAPVIVNYLSYFTIDSNTLAAIVLVVSAVMLARGSRAEPRALTVARVAVTTYMIITGVVYNLLLRGSLEQGATVAWSNEILHLVGPLYLVLDWTFAPGRHRLSWGDAVPALVFPTVWVAYTLIRGPFATNPYVDAAYWYPYPFLNPVTSTGGYASVAAYVLGIAVVTILLAVGLAWTTRRRPALASHRPRPDPG